MKRLMVIWAALASLAWSGEVEVFIETAEKKHGEIGGKAARFLVKGMPKADRETLSQEFLMTNLDLA